MTTNDDGGWVRAWRRLFAPSHDLAGGPVCKRFAWLDLCQLAAHRDLGKYDLRRGEVRVRYSQLARRWGWSPKQVRTFVGALVALDRITPVASQSPGDRRGITYAIVNYDVYQPRSGHPKRTFDPPF